MDYELLYEVSCLDREIIKYKRELSKREILDKLNTYKKEYEVLRFEYEKETKESIRLAEEINLLSKQIDLNNIKIKEYEAKLYETGNIKSIEMCQHSISKLEQEVKALEDRIYELMTKSEKLNKNRKEVYNKLQNIKEIYNKNLLEYKNRQSKFNNLIFDLNAKREELLGKIDKDLRKSYEEITKTTGYGMSEVKEEICLGCGKGVPIVIINSVKDTDTLTKCPNCGRYLYLIE